MICRGCGAGVRNLLVDLGSTPAANRYLTGPDLNLPEEWYPLKVFVCSECHLAQTEYVIDAQRVFQDNYAYLSSISESWLEHASTFASEMITALKLDSHSFVAEVASNDGYLLRNFVNSQIPCLGIEPSRLAAEAAQSSGVPTVNEFLTIELAERIKASSGPADLVVANNVLAHVPAPQELLQALEALVSANGLVVCEFAYLLDLIEKNQFDTIYHEHYSYLSLQAVEELGKSVGLEVIDAKRLKSHGGSLRVTFVPMRRKRAPKPTDGLNNLRQAEVNMAIHSESTRSEFQKQVQLQSNDLDIFLREQHIEGRQVAAYGAAAKGNTRLNVAGITYPLLSFVAERSPTKVGKYLPGSHVPVLDESALTANKPDFILLLPWNLATELVAQLEYTREWGARFVIPSPRLTVV